jgi:hypothetical protein
MKIKEFKKLTIINGRHLDKIDEYLKILEKDFIIYKNFGCDLHPEKQVDEVKKFMIYLKNNSDNKYFILTSNSPYIIKAVRFYGDKHKIRDKINYYITQKENNKIIIKNVKEFELGLGIIFDELCHPLDKLIWSNMTEYEIIEIKE